jgi:hypothetical protein
LATASNCAGFIPCLGVSRLFLLILVEDEASISIPIEFDKQDEGHDYHGPSTWKVITTYYNNKGVYPYKKYNNKNFTL